MMIRCDLTTNIYFIILIDILTFFQWTDDQAISRSTQKRYRITVVCK